MEKQFTVIESTMSVVIPGIMFSIDKLIKSCSSILGMSTTNDIPTVHGAKMSFGILGSITILSAQCLETLLNYKIELEGNKYIKTHDLYSLYNALSEQSKFDIESEFTILSNNGVILPVNVGPKSAEETIKQSRKALIVSRYISCAELSKNTPTLTIKQINAQELYKVTKSVYNTIDIFKT